MVRSPDFLRASWHATSGLSPEKTVRQKRIPRTIAAVIGQMWSQRHLMAGWLTLFALAPIATPPQNEGQSGRAPDIARGPSLDPTETLTARFAVTHNAAFPRTVW